MRYSNPLLNHTKSQQNNSNAISDGANVEQSGGTVDQNLAPAGEVHAHFESLYNNLVTQVEKVNQLLKEKSTVSRLEEDKKKLKSDFKTREDELLDKQIDLKKKIKELDNILLKQEVFVSQKAKLREEVYFSNTSKTADVSTSFSIPNDEISDDASPSVARIFLNEIHTILKDEIVPIVNQVDAKIQNFKNHFVKEAAKFVRDLKSLAKEADDSLDKIKVLKKKDFLLRAVVSQDIMSIVLNNSVVDTCDLQTKLDATKEKMETCIIKKDKEYAVL
ncbi:hypothetical protein Tco_0879303 [Tanacetum coccineum]